jgi:hypothetical protein
MSPSEPIIVKTGRLDGLGMWLGMGERRNKPTYIILVENYLQNINLKDREIEG